MAGYICIAMLEDPPYNMILAATEEEPEDWLEELPLPSHLLCYESFKDTKVILKQFIQRLKLDGITAKADKAFTASPHEVIRRFIEVRNEAENNNQLVKDAGDDYDEGKRLYNLAVEYEDGSNKIIPDLKKAFKLFMQAAELGYNPAYFALALAYSHDGNGVKKDLNESLKWAMRHIEGGGVQGYYVAADCFVEAGMKEQASDIWRRCFKERSTEDIKSVLSTYAGHASKDLVEQVHTPKIARLFGAAAEQEGIRQSYNWLLENQVTDSDFDDTDETEQGDAEAQFELGQMYKLGSGVEVDNKQAVYWYRKAAIQGNPAAQFELGQMYYNDPRGGGGREDDEQWIYWYRKAAEQGNPAAQFEVGQWYRYEDDEQAMLLYRKAAEQGYPAAQVMLGEMYAFGDGVEKDNEQALCWYRKAAEQGDAEAQFELGTRYAFGNGVEEDDEQALYWYRKAAEQGVADAQFELGTRYAFGNGVEEDEEQAVFWYRKASEQGSTWAKEALIELGVDWES